MTQLIGLGGVATSGKDAAADFLVEHGWFKTYMSKPLERALLAVNPDVNVAWDKWQAGTWPKDTLMFTHYISYKSLHELVGYDVSKCCTSVRGLLQRLGTEVGRDMIDQNLWVDLAFREVDEHLDAGESVAITGIRFVNELEALHGRGGLSVWVERGLSPVNSHVSDNALTAKDFQVVLSNNGTLEDLKKQVLALVTTTEEKAA
jgi:hypothetical protein